MPHVAPQGTTRPPSGSEAHQHDGRLDRARTSLAAARRIVTRYGFRRLDGLAGTVLGEIHLAAGANLVATVDIDQVLVAEAQSRLNRIGYQPVAEAGDGAAGLPAAAPYDRVLSTCSAGSVPTAWINQLADDGLIVAPLTYGGALAVLYKTGPAEASGRLATEQACFMPLHAAGEAMPDSYLVDLPQLSEADTSPDTTTDIPIEPWRSPDFRLWLALHLPHSHIADLVNEQMHRIGVVVYTADQRAQVDYTADDPGRWPVVQGSDRLWDTVEAAWSAWQQHDQPDRTRIGITARADGEQWAWLDHPNRPLGPAASDQRQYPPITGR